MISKDTTWANVKAMLSQRALAAQWVQIDSVYCVAAIDGDFALECRININTPLAGGVLDPVIDASQIDFETNFKTKGNIRLTAQIDSDNASFSRTKQAPTGWTYQLRGINFTTSTFGSMVNKTETDTDSGDSTLKFYNASGIEVTDPTLSTTITKTVFDLEPAYDYYIIGGIAKVLVTPTNDVRLNVTAAPDVPFSYGGSRVMIKGVNFKFVGANDKVDADGRASKMLTFSSSYHSSKLRFSVYHSAGEAHSFAVFLEHYKV